MGPGRLLAENARVAPFLSNISRTALSSIARRIAAMRFGYGGFCPPSKVSTVRSDTLARLASLPTRSARSPFL
jgi:hypothetical protein